MNHNRPLRCVFKKWNKISSIERMEYLLMNHSSFPRMVNSLLFLHRIYFYYQRD
uniref:Uncharacterized protein n=1 Tax=Lepeophtheirus salmonis TaxID=72036 RepID=A0A0K2TLD3_LEPSM